MSSASLAVLEVRLMLNGQWRRIPEWLDLGWTIEYEARLGALAPRALVCVPFVA
jgi:hypothetical protein